MMKCTQILFLVCVFLSGCQSFEYHPWQENKSRFTPTDITNRDYVTPDNLFRPTKNQSAAAIELLQDCSQVKLSPDEFKKLTGTELAASKTNAPYLIRGVTWGVPHSYSLVYFSRATDVLYIEQYTYNGELYIPGKYESVAHPVIAILSKEPNDIVPNAIWGGDWIMRGLFSPHSWKEFETEKVDSVGPR